MNRYLELGKSLLKMGKTKVSSEVITKSKEHVTDVANGVVNNFIYKIILVVAVVTIGIVAISYSVGSIISGISSLF